MESGRDRLASFQRSAFCGSTAVRCSKVREHAPLAVPRTPGSPTSPVRKAKAEGVPRRSSQGTLTRRGHFAACRTQEGTVQPVSLGTAGTSLDCCWYNWIMAVAFLTE